MTDADTFERGLDEDPANWNLREVYADWLEEQGDLELAAAQRWMAENRAHCWFRQNSNIRDSKTNASWYRQNMRRRTDKIHFKERARTSSLPLKLFQNLRPWKTKMSFRIFYDRIAAERALADSIATVNALAIISASPASQQIQTDHPD